MESALPSWVEDAARLPVAFAQVREDPLIDEWVIDQLPSRARMLMICSGGCTLAYIKTHLKLAAITVIDPNPAQIALAQLKVELVERIVGSPNRFFLRNILGHAPFPATEREWVLRKWSASLDRIGPLPVLLTDGPDYAGRYERVFAQLQRSLREQCVEVELEAVLSLSDPAEQAKRVAPGTALGDALDQAFDRAMDLPILVRLFGEGATRNRVEPFSRHFARRTRHVLATLPAATNPYVWQVLLGQYPVVGVPWLMKGRAGGAPITWIEGVFMADFLRDTDEQFDFIHLSNILDWLSPQEAHETLVLTQRRLKPGGWVLIRQLNSTLDIPAAGPGFDWLPEQAAKLHAMDRSYFYRAIHLGRRR